MELAKIRSLGDAELAHQERTSAEQLFRLRFQVAMGQNDGVKKLRQLRKEIAWIKTVTRERELGIHGEAKEAAEAAPAEEPKTPQPEEAAPAAETQAAKVKKTAAKAKARTVKAEEVAPAARTKARKAKKAAPVAKKKTGKAKEKRK